MGRGRVISPEAKEENRRRAELATRLYEESVLGRKIASFVEGINALQYMFTPEGKKMLEEAWKAENGAKP